jgi:hypothetical protein
MILHNKRFHALIVKDGVTVPLNLPNFSYSFDTLIGEHESCSWNIQEKNFEAILLFLVDLYYLYF